MMATLLRWMTLFELLWAAGIAVALHRAGWSWPAAVALGLAAPFAVHALIVAAGFLLSARHAGDGRARLGAWGVARLYLQEAWSSLRAFQFAFPWGTWRVLPGTRGAGADGPVPVLLIHGYLCNRQVWYPMAKRLAARGHAIEAIDLEPPLAPIDAYAATVDAGVSRLRARTGAAKVAIVGHSMGGLAARAYLRAFGADAVAGVVTLGSPHRGTLHARLAPGGNAACMRHGSAWLDALASSESPALRGSMTIVLTVHDNIVCPQAAQTLPGAEVVALSGLGHLALVYDRGVQQRVADRLAAFRSEAPSSAAGTRAGPR